jgi:glycosyltransferase involved in cell wall biosynthesis
MKIAISIAVVGGTGGVARNIFSLVKAMEKHEMDIYTMRYIPRGLVPQGKNVTIRWFENGPDGPRINIENKDYDLYIYYASRSPIYLGNHLGVRKKMILPCGNDVRDVEQHFDFVLCQAEDGTKYFNDVQKKAVIEPCVIIPVDQVTPINGIPSEFFLTVFNPYDLDRQYEDGWKPCKGYDLLYETAEHLVMPLVWCHGDEAVDFGHNIRNHPNIIHFSSLGQDKLYYLYQHATVYVSYSREEGFGWSVADAVLFDKPIISRRTGVLSSVSPNQKGLYLYKNRQELQKLLRRTAFETGKYEKEQFSSERFEEKLISLTDDITAPQQVS